MSEERWKPHVTVAAVIEREGRFLLVEEHTSQGLKLNNPAGHLEPGEAPGDGVVREVLEETARAFTPQALVGVHLSRSRRARPEEDVTYLRFTYCGPVGEEIAGRGFDQGIVRTLWLSPDELRADPGRLRSPLVLQSIDDYLAGKRHPMDVVAADITVYGPG